MQTEAEHLLSLNNWLGEGCRWHSGEQQLYWVDIRNNCFYRWDTTSEQPQRHELGVATGVVGFRAQGGLVMGTKRGFAFWDVQSGVRFIGNPEEGKEEMRFNDGLVDSRGRFWGNTMTENDANRTTMLGSLYRLDPDGSMKTMDTGFPLPNGLGWSPDDCLMYLTDSQLRKIFVYDFDVESGSIANRRTFVEVPESEGVPDGLTIDADGYVWSAHWGGWKVVRYAPDGSVDREIHVPVSQPSCCVLGGAQLNKLYITTAWEHMSEEARKQQPFSGDLFWVVTDVKGLPGYTFAG